MTLYERPGDDIDKGLVGYWKLDDLKAGPEISVAIGRAKFSDGAITGATNTSGINGLSPDAMLFDGSNDNVDLNTNFAGLRKFSFSIWARKEGEEATTNNYIMDDSPGSTGISMRIITASNKIETFVYDGSANFLTVTSTNVLPENEWVHIVMTYDGLKVRIYFNAVLEGTSSNTGDNSGIGESSQDIRLGSEYDGTDHFLGRLSNARFYDRILTLGEISKLHRLRK